MIRFISQFYIWSWWRFAYIYRKRKGFRQYWQFWIKIYYIWFIFHQESPLWPAQKEFGLFVSVIIWNWLHYIHSRVRWKTRCLTYLQICFTWMVAKKIEKIHAQISNLVKSTQFGWNWLKSAHNHQIHLNRFRLTRIALEPLIDDTHFEMKKDRFTWID